MGFKISWLAVQGADRAAMLDHLGLADTGEVDQANEAPFSVADLPTGWTIVWANDFDYADDQRASRLSALGPTLSVQLHEGVMYAQARYYTFGERRWSIVYDSDEDKIDQDGALPVQAAEIEAACRAEQAAADAAGEPVSHLFDFPLRVAKSLCGFRHDNQLVNEVVPVFTVAAAPGKPPHRRWWS